MNLTYYGIINLSSGGLIGVGNDTVLKISPTAIYEIVEVIIVAESSHPRVCVANFNSQSRANIKLAGRQ